MVNGICFTDFDAFHTFAAHPAVQAAPGLLSCHLFRKAKIHFVKRGDPLFGFLVPGEDTTFCTEALRNFAPVLARRILSLYLLGIVAEILSVDVAIHGLYYHVATGYRFYNGCRPAHCIACSKYMGDICLHGLGVHIQGPPSRNTQTLQTFQPVQVRPLANGRNNRVALNHKL